MYPQSAAWFKHTICLLLILLTGFNIAMAQSPIPGEATVDHIDFANSFQLCEGPYWHPDGYLLFSDVWAGVIHKWTEENGLVPFITPSGQSNGITADYNGNLLIAQHQSRQIGRIESNLSITPIATHYNGNRFHSPNDLTVKSDGAIFFTDPPWGGNPSEMAFHGVYRIPPGGGEPQLLIDSLSYPNGIVFSPDETLLYVDDSNGRHVFVYDVVNDTALANGRLFVTIGGSQAADGMKVDHNGNLYVTGNNGLLIYAPTGDLLDHITVPGTTTNLAWGGSDRLILFISGFNELYKIEMGDLPTVAEPDGLQATQLEAEISLNWNAPSEQYVKYYTIYKSTDSLNFTAIARTNETTYSDADIVPGQTHSYKVTTSGFYGNQSGFSNTVSTNVTDLRLNNNSPGNYHLSQNYPNPFNPSTTISYMLDKPSHVTLKVFDLAGHEVETLVDQQQVANSYSLRFNASGLSSGVYFYKLQAGKNFTEIKKMLLVR
jgi:sugar lactone lactonase YvrE